MVRCAAGRRCIRCRGSTFGWLTAWSRFVRGADRADLVGIVSRAPLDAAADARHLVLGGRSSLERGADRGAQVGAGHRPPVPGPAIVELSAVDEAPVRTEEEEVR